MIKTHIIACSLPFEKCEALNRASGKAYTDAMALHWRLFRKHDIWLNPLKDSRVFTAIKGDTIPRAMSVQAAYQDFYEACKTAKELKKTAPEARYPYKRKYYRTTTWKNPDITMQEKTMRLRLARGEEPLPVAVPDHLAGLPEKAYRQVQLVFDTATRKNYWHLTIEDGIIPVMSESPGIMAVDMGEIHPAACTSGEKATLICCRALRENSQHRNKKTADLQERIAQCKRGSRRWKKLVNSRKRLQDKYKKVQRDLLHKVSRAVVSEAQDMQAGSIVGGISGISQIKPELAQILMSQRHD